MGYELSLCRRGSYDSEPYSDDDTFWFCCGWDKTELFSALAALSDGTPTTEPRECAVVPVERLRFLVTVADQVKANPIMEWADRLGSLDWQWREEFFEGLSPEVMAACRVSYFVEGASDDELNVLGIIANLSEYHGFDVVSLGDAVRRLLDDGVETVEVIGA